MDKKDILALALAQSAADINCAPEDFLRQENVIVESVIGPHARSYYHEPIAANLVSYGSNIVASVKEPYREIVENYIGRFEFYHCFETPNLHVLEQALEPLGQKVCFMAEYWLPDPDRLRPLPCAYETRLLCPEDFAALYLPEWSNALCADRRQLDMLAVGAYDGGALVGLAGCSADGETTWQIGIDVLPAYRRRGVAKALTAALALECFERNKLPYYCCAWSNIPSARNAFASGFAPAWVELTVKPSEVVDGMNR